MFKLTALKMPIPIRLRHAVLAVLACAMASVMADEGAQRALSAGSFTVMRFDRTAYTEPAPVLTLQQHQQFMFGRNVFQRKWAAVVSLNGDWGLGPTFIASQCSQCHLGDGRGNTPQGRDEQLLSLLVRLSIPGEDEHGGPRPHPDYGDQFQNRALQGQSIDLAYAIEPIPAEADLFLDWEEQVVSFADGESISLRKPKLRIEQLRFGPLAADTMLSLRIAQPARRAPVRVGGLVEQVPHAAGVDDQVTARERGAMPRVG